MINTAGAKSPILAPLLAALLSLGLVLYLPAAAAQESTDMNNAHVSSTALTAQQRAIVPVAALAAEGNITRLNSALEQALDAEVTVNEAKEILVQVYAYAGFPRSLNALAELMKVTEARKSRGLHDEPGREPSKPVPKGTELLNAGTANQTRLVGAPVKGPLFEFAPVVDEYLKTHLFGDIFERDNVTWQVRELATVSMLSAIPGAEAQLQSHMRISMNVGLTEGQLRELAHTLHEHVDPQNAERANEALTAALSAYAKA
ncbi:carboxymuconolactone decarboxylase family protein [Pseudomonas cannabina]|uniref:Carboxymuconolactone decarboxylase n=3 Tax=Pseudomonas syringae group TaxID=136849 RepID=A0A8T8C9E8_PSEYM|nr:MULTISPECIES: carboxymuconolactone decarboxylase family protein [Pseudomonas syringae group]KPB71259.1 Carboxymuconolactone decarboxylase [Pseudomonas syringae pv. maculicola]KPW25865.1 Carboxymuconolactone decarboxylase [Pseudomonas cannabina pv. alisalensis]QHF00231.1 carboxymuconolactone decarboxylase [Pseudomonas syringae pv. maculicola str. ES4326]RMN88033.1 Carboxymuconolactone decarboxylase [Pseudomonas cannabina]UBZ00248.1 carboxymuconolactone decarboxylase family protein [Pseudomon